MVKEIENIFFSFRQQYLQITIVNSINRRCISIEFIESLTNPNTDWQLDAFVVGFSIFFIRFWVAHMFDQILPPTPTISKRSFDFRLNEWFSSMCWFGILLRHITLTESHGHGFLCDEPTSNQQYFGQKMYQHEQWSREHAPGATANRTMSAHSRRRE